MKSNYLARFECEVHGETKEMEKKLIDLTDEIIVIVKKNGLNPRQAEALLKMVKAEIQECTLA